MMTKRISNQIGAKQVYEVWSSEPELLRILDLRDPGSFARTRLPGSSRIASLEAANDLAKQQPHLLFVIVTENGALDSEGLLQNMALLQGGITEWIAMNLPRCPQDADYLRSHFRKAAAMDNEILFYQLFEPITSTYTYLLADRDNREAVLIDPVLQTVDRDLKLVEEHGLKLLYVLDTHVHADHVTGADEIRKRTGAKTGVSRKAQVACADLALEEGQEIRFGRHALRVLETPGHTNGCLSFYCAGRVFTGDALLIRGTGRTDFQQGSSETLYDSIQTKLFALPLETIVYPGHDYRGQTHSTIEMEIKFNPRLGGGKSKRQFIDTMNELKLQQPAKIHEAVPANLQCGRAASSLNFHPQIVNGVPEITPQDLYAHLKQAVMIDVRRIDEFTNELGHVPGSQLVTLGEDLTQHLATLPRDKEIVFICRSGNRSARATEEALKMGFKNAINMQGGMLLWNDLHLPTEGQSLMEKAQ